MFILIFLIVIVYGGTVLYTFCELYNHIYENQKQITGRNIISILVFSIIPIANLIVVDILLDKKYKTEVGNCRV